MVSTKQLYMIMAAQDTALDTRIDGVAGVSDDAEEALDTRMDTVENTTASHTTSIGTNVSDIAAMKAGTATFAAVKATEMWDDTHAARILVLAPGGSTPVNYLTIRNANTGGAPEIGVGGADTDIDINLEPKGSGDCVLGGSGARYIENATPVALGVGSAAPDTSGIVVDANAKTAIDALIVILKAARICAP